MNTSPGADEERTDDTSYSIDDCKILKELAAGKKEMLGVPLLQAHLNIQGKRRREQQERMVFEVENALDRRGTALFVQAGTGTGKSYAYIFGVAPREGRYVIATATNQLGEQLAGKDLPAAAETLAEVGIPFSYALLKGRNNYACKLKMDSVKKLERTLTELSGGASPEYATSAMVFGDEDTEDVEKSPLSRRRKNNRKDENTRARMWENLFEWERTTMSGDRSDAPAVTDEVWAEASATASECVGRECPFYGSCYSENARAKAKKAKIVVTNHALLAQEMKLALGNSENASGSLNILLTQNTRGVIVDEGHDFVDTVSDAFSVTIDTHHVRENVKKLQRAVGRNEAAEQFADLLGRIDRLEVNLKNMPTLERIGSLPADTTEILKDSAHAMTNLFGEFSGRQFELGEGATITQLKKAVRVHMLARQLGDAAKSIIRVLKAEDSDAVWCEEVTKARSRQQKPRLSADDTRVVIKMSPVDVGDKIEEIFNGTTLIVTSATLTLNGSFSPTLKAFGFADVSDVSTVDVGSPFNYAQQGMLYIPQSPFPAPVGKERVEHTAAVLSEVEELVVASGGRALLLFTTTRDAQECADVLSDKLPHLNILKHGDAPANVLVKSFVDDETSVLCATMGMWQGVDAAGPTCSLVVINKVAFPPPTDVLNATKIDTVNRNGGNGFTEIVLPSAAASLAQAAGRLIRSHTDKGVVAILDPRLHTKSYGRDIIGSLPEFGIYSNGDTVKEALQRLTSTYTDGTGTPPKTSSAPGRTVPSRKPAAQSRESARKSSPTSAKSMKKRVINRRGGKRKEK